MARKVKQIDKSTRPPLKLDSSFITDNFLMYLIQDVTKLPTSDILGFFADLAKAVAEEGVHFMYEQGTSTMRKEIFDFFPGTSIPFSLLVEGSKYRAVWWYNPTTSKYEERIDLDPIVRKGTYCATAGFPDHTSNVDQTKLADIIMEKAILGACDMPPFEKPDPRCPKMYRDLMKEIRSRRMVENNG